MFVELSTAVTTATCPYGPPSQTATAPTCGVVPTLKPSARADATHWLALPQ